MRARVKSPTPVYSHADAFPVDGAIAAPWIDGHAEKPNSWEPIGVRDGAAVIWQDRTRAGTYQANQATNPPSPPGTLWAAIGCAYHETGSLLPDVEVTWNGHFAWNVNPNEHVEGTPLLYVDPDKFLGGFGAWPTHIGVTPAILVGYIGSPAENFTVVGLSDLTGVDEGVPHTIRLQAVAVGRVILWWDGERLPVTRSGTPYSTSYWSPLDPIPVHPSLTASTKHGFALDGHVVLPTGDVTTTPGIYDFSLSAY